MTMATAPGAREITIRMYNVGFGDAFLVMIPSGSKRVKMLFDCGSIQAAAGHDMEEVVKGIVKDVTDSDGVARIDVVVATHRHKDHVSGFANSAWDEVEVKEVWMPWTEDPTDAEARRIRDIQSRLALTLDQSLRLQAAVSGVVLPQNFAVYRDVVDNALMLSNDRAMKTLHHGFSGQAVRRFLPTKTPSERSFTLEAMPMVKVHVMGPARSREVILDMDPPKGQSYLRLNAVLPTSTSTLPAPFEDEFVDKNSPLAPLLDLTDQLQIQTAGSPSDLAVAVALDKAVNGTSLMLMLQVSGTYLLFPGDAQWGTWQLALADSEWREMLTRTAFYKIGHHGSHNATPREFVDTLIPDGVCAMASTCTRKVWPDIPKLPLLEALTGKKAKVVRSDQETLPMPPGFTASDGVVEVRLPF
jgi:beta-lactamase superfamily II metal-dependent hydrolase